MYEFMFVGVTRLRKSTYSSEWNCVISRFVAGFALCWCPSKPALGVTDKDRSSAREMNKSEKLATHENLHLLVKPIVHNQRMTHAYTSRLHPDVQMR